MLDEIVAKHTGQSMERIRRETQRDRYMSAEEAKEWGVIDEIIIGKAAKAEEGKGK